MIRHLIRAFCVTCILAFAGTAQAADRGTADDAVALVKKAVALYKSEGKAKALAAYLDPSFQPKDLFVLVHDTKGVVVQHPKNPALNGKDNIAGKDADGKPFIADMVRIAQEKGSGWVDYKVINAQTKNPEQKSLYFERADDLIIGAGIFK